MVWSSSDEGIATVDSNGLVTAVSEGIATITVTTDDGGYQDTIEVTVIEPIANELPAKELEGVIIFPNPTTDEINIGIPKEVLYENPIEEVRLFDSSGRLILALRNNGPTQFSNVFEFDVSLVESGMYTLHIIHSDKMVHTKRFLVK